MKIEIKDNLSDSEKNIDNEERKEHFDDKELETNCCNNEFENYDCFCECDCDCNCDCCEDCCECDDCNCECCYHKTYSADELFDVLEEDFDSKTKEKGFDYYQNK